MKKSLLLALIILALAILPALSCTGATKTATSNQTQALEIVKKPVIKPPVIKDILGPKQAAPSFATQYTCYAIDPDGRKMTYEWSVDSGIVKSDGKKEVIWNTPSKPGTYTLNVKVTNDAGLSDNMSKVFEVVETPASHQYTDKTVYLKLQLPGGETVKANSPILVSNIGEVQVNVEGKDPSQLTFTWKAPIGKISGNGLAEGKASRIGWIAPGTPGDYTVSVVVSDQSGGKATGEVTFNVFTQ